MKNHNYILSAIIVELIGIFYILTNEYAIIGGLIGLFLAWYLKRGRYVEEKLEEEKEVGK